MEGPEIEGPQVWLDLNRKCEAKIISLINKNKERSAWLHQYYEDCKAKLVAKCPEPEFVPKTPAQPKRGGRRGKASTANQEQADVSKTSSSTTSTRSTRATRASRAPKRDVTLGSVDDTDEKNDNANIENRIDDSKNENCIDDANNQIEVSYTPPPPKKPSLTSPKPPADIRKSLVVCAEVANATYSSQDSTEVLDVPNATFDVDNVPDATFDVGEEEEFVDAGPVVNQTFDTKVDNEQVNSDENQFVEAEAVGKPQEVVNNIVEILKSAQKINENLSPIPAPRAVNQAKVVEGSVESIDEAHSRPSRSTRTKQKLVPQDESVFDKTKACIDSNDTTASRPSRTKSKTASASSASTEDEDPAPTRSTRTRQKNPPSTGSETDCVEDARPVRSTRTKQKQLAQSCSESTLTKGAASPRVRELAAKVLSPAMKQSSSTSRLPGGYSGSPVKDRVKIFENAMRDSAGLRSHKKSKRKSSISSSLSKASAARNISINEVIAEQEVIVKKGPTIRKSPGVSSSTSSLNNSRAPAGKVVRPGKKVFASGGRGVSPATGPRSGSHTGSSSSLVKSRSRLDIVERNKITPSKNNTPSNMVRGGLTTFLPAKPKGPTLQEIQEQKDEERRQKEQREIEAKQRREEQMKNKMEEKKLKNEERIRRVQEARQKQESLREDKMRKNHEKEKEDKLAMLKKREENLKAEAEKRKKENELKLKEAEERRNREEEERIARMDRLEDERREEERKKEEDLEQRRRKQDEERKRKLYEEEKRKKAEELKREEVRQAEEKKRAAAAQQERIQREKEELRKLKEKEVARQGDTTLNRTVTLDQSQAGVSSYDMTPARHELPPEPSQAEDNYGLDDLKSDEDTDDEDCPRKQVPKWAEGTQLRTSLLKQCYMGPDLDKIFATIEMPDLSSMFHHQRKRFHKRTSSAVWETPPESFKHSKRW